MPLPHEASNILPPDDLDPEGALEHNIQKKPSKTIADLNIPAGPLCSAQLKLADQHERGFSIPGLTIRPVRVAALGKSQKLTKEDKTFLKQAEQENFTIRYIPNAKEVNSKSAIRYRKYQGAQTISEALRLGAFRADINWDYCRGYVLFPSREPKVHAHYASDFATLSVFGPEEPILTIENSLSVLDLFCGTKSLQPICQELKWQYCSVDINQKYQPDILTDVLTWDYQHDLRDRRFDIVFCSPPCTLFSKMRYAPRTLKRMNKTLEQAEHDMLSEGIPLLDRTREIIDWLRENCHTSVYFIENPATGRMKEFLIDLIMYEVDYCAYQPDFGYKKPTGIWSNIDPTTFTPRRCLGIDCPATLPGTRKHLINGFRDGVSKELLYRVPIDLLRDLMKAAYITIHGAEPQRVVQVNYLDLSESDAPNPLPSFQSLVKNLFPPEQVPEFMLTQGAYLRFGLDSFNQLCLHHPSEHVQCHTAFIGDSNIPANLKPQQVKTPKQDGNLNNNDHHVHWLQAMTEEMEILENRNCWTWQDRTVAEQNPNYKRCRPIPTIWVHKVKTNDKGFVYRFRSRLVVRGDLTIEGVHYTDVFAPVVSMDSVRTILSLAAANPDYDVYQGDISAAFIHPKLKDDIWITPPPRFNRTGKDGRPQVLKLLRTLYGLKTSPLAWFECFSETIKGFAKEYSDVTVTQLVADNCIFIICKDDDKVFTTIYVDDVLTVSTSISIRQWFFQALSKHFDLQNSETGKCTWLLGIRVNVDRKNNRITLSQEQAIQKIVETQALTPDDTSVTPMTADLKLVRLEAHDPTIDPETCMNGLSFRSVLGSVLYISTSTRPDIAFPVNLIARHVTGLGPPHVKALLRVVKYLNGSQSWGIQFICPERPMQTLGYQAATHPCDIQREHVMRCFADADYAQSEDRKSTTGYTIVLNGGPVCWRSSRQKIIAQSTAEAEIISATEAGKDVIHTRLLLTELGYPEQVNEPTILYEDNMSCIYLARNLKSRRTAKHFEIRLRFLQQMVLDQEIQFIHVGTSDQIADMLTKALNDNQFLTLRARLLADCSVSNLTNTES